MVGGRLHRLTTAGSQAPIIVTYKGVASISLVVLLFLVFSEPRMSAGAIAALAGTSVLVAAIVAIVTRLSRTRMDSDKG